MKYIAVIKRAIPVNDYSVETIAGTFAGDVTLDEVVDWAHGHTERAGHPLIELKIVDNAI